MTNQTTSQTKEYKIAISEDYIETIWVEAKSEEEAIERAIMKSSFQQPVFNDVDEIKEITK